MNRISISAFELAQRFVGVKEIPGTPDNPAILAMLKLDNDWPEHDEVPWCSAFVNYIAWLLRLPRSKDLRARSWLQVGLPVDEPDVGMDVVILNRANGHPDPAVIDGPGHVGFYAGMVRHPPDGRIALLGGNQGDAVSISTFNLDRVLGYRRLV